MMRHELDSGGKTPIKSLLRFDPAHAMPENHQGPPILNSRRVRQVVTGSAGMRVSGHLREQGETATTFRVGPSDSYGNLESQKVTDPVVRRFRDNFHTLSHIARDPLLWYAEQGAVLADLRETLFLTESALLQFQATGTSSPLKEMASQGVLALAKVVEERVDQLFDRMERLSSLRQCLYRMGAVLDGVASGRAPRVGEMDWLATRILDVALCDDGAITLVDPESTDRAIRLAAHVLNVAQVAARLVASVPAWREESTLAVTAALLQDLGMMQVPVDLLNSPQSLTAPQRALIQQHPATSASIVKQIRGHDERLVNAVCQHHERLDGSGYPKHYRGATVGSAARLLAVADTYVGMQSPRPYRPALSVQQALHEIEQSALCGKLDRAWTKRLPVQSPRWLKIPVAPEPPASAPAVSALAA